MIKHVAIIPARAGSKTIPNKNLTKLKGLGGKSLVHLAIESAQGAGIFDKIVLSTDIPLLVDEFKDSLDITLIQRAPDLATDDAKMNDVVLEAMYQLQIPHNYFFWLLQPTSPFRIKEDYTAIVNLIHKHHGASVISVKDVGAYHPNRTYTIVRNELKPLRFTNFDNKQKLKPVYIRNGCFYVCNVGAFRAVKNFYLEPCTPYEMPEERSVNIDGPLDLIQAHHVSSSRSKSA